MSTDPTRQSADGKNLGAKGRFARWILAGLGLAWLAGAVLRRRGGLILSNCTVADAWPCFSPAKPARRGHEKRDANAKWIFGIVAFLFISGLSIHFILAGWLKALNATPPPTDPWSGSVRQTGGTRRPGVFPLLQVSPPAELQAFREREEAELATYGWINKTSGVVRIPISVAMDLVLKQALPVRSQTNSSQVGPSSYQLSQERAQHRSPPKPTPP